MVRCILPPYRRVRAASLAQGDPLGRWYDPIGGDRLIRSFCGAIVAWVFVLCVLAMACREGDQASRTQGGGRRHRPNIIFLTVDTLRADHLHLYGYERDTMPAIEAFAKTAVVFDSAVVPRGSTRPSYASMLTGLYPYQHGVRSNWIRLHDDLTTLPEVLRAARYHTAAFVSNFVLVGELSGLAQGFDVYDDWIEEREGERLGYERKAAKTLEAILQWIGTDPPEPFFLFVNFIDPHGPYRPPDNFRAIFHSGLKRLLQPDLIPAYQRYEDSLDYYDFLDRYDGEIRYTDAALGALIEELQERGLWDDAIVLFTADHGESLGEHRIYFEHHSHVWEETIRVPLAIRLPVWMAPGGRTPPSRVGRLASPMDLMPTIMAALDIELSPGLAGRSLLPVWRGLDLADRGLLIEFPSVASPGMGLPDVYAVRTSTHKLIRALDPNTGWQATRALVFDVRADPLEKTGAFYDERLPEHVSLSARLDNLLAELGAYRRSFDVTEYRMPGSEQEAFVKGRSSEREPVSLSEEQIQRLKSLGYVR